jgi:site-specific DNA-methyltransferase (adenine-specific)
VRVAIKCKGAAVVEMDDLHGLQGDLKELSEEDEDKLRGNIETAGFIAPIFVWTNPKNGKPYIVDGHQRIHVLQGMRAAGWEVPKLPVDYIHASTLKDARRKLLMIVSQFGKVTKGGLERFIEMAGIDLADLKFEVTIPGIDLRFTANETAGDDAPPVKPKVADTKPGETWLLGRHSLHCTGKMKPLKIEMAAHLLVGDVRDDVDWGKVSDLLGDGASAYVFYDDVAQASTPIDMGLAGFEVRQQIVWVKDTYEVSSGAYGVKHEAIIMGRKPGRDHQKGVYAVKPGAVTWKGKKQDTVWEYPRPIASKKYPTLKPVEIYVRAILNSTVEGECILDPWAGTGTCLIAAEKTGRWCEAVESDPFLCDVAVQRFRTWCKANGVVIEVRRE